MPKNRNMFMPNFLYQNKPLLSLYGRHGKISFGTGHPKIEKRQTT